MENNKMDGKDMGDLQDKEPEELQPLHVGGSSGSGGEPAQEQQEQAKEDEEPTREVVEEGRRPVVRKGPDQPTAAEVSEHRKTHVPYRNWCPHCVAGRGRNDPHRTGVVKSPEFPMLCIDYGS